MYNLLLFVHVLGAIIWVGGGFALNILGTRLTRASDPKELAGFARQTAFLGARVFAPVSALMFLAGVGMTVQAWDFKDLWIAIGVAGFLYSFITGAGIIGPLSGKTGRLIEERGAGDSQVAANIRKLFLFGRIELLVMVVVVAAMTMKPTLD